MAFFMRTVFMSTVFETLLIYSKVYSKEILH